jgi:hypothetical protein
MLQSFTKTALSLLRTHCRLALLPCFAFSRKAKNSQLILHSNEQIENMISKKNTKL